MEGRNLKERIAELEAQVAALQVELEKERQERAELVDKMEQLLEFSKLMRAQRDGAIEMTKKLLNRAAPEQGIAVPEKKIILPGN
jgi:cell division protein FtsB